MSSTQVDRQGSGTKVCVSCGRDVTHDRRMKDSQGRYWCVACGQADQMKRAGGAGKAVGTTCADCKSPVDARDLMKLGDRFVCPACFAVLTGKKIAPRASTDDENRKRKIKLIVAVVMLVIGLGLIVAHVMELI